MSVRKFFPYLFISRALMTSCSINRNTSNICEFATTLFLFANRLWKLKSIISASTPNVLGAFQMSEYLPATNFCKYSSAVRISRKVRLSMLSLSFDCNVSSKSENRGKSSALKFEQSVVSVIPFRSYVSTTRLLISSITSLLAPTSTILKKLSNILRCVLNVTTGSAGVPSSVSIL